MEFGPVIKNPVLDINKLVRQGTMLNQSVQTVEGDSTADQATVDLLANKDPVIREIAVGMSGEEASLYTVYGTPPLSLPNSLGKPLKAWSVDLLPYQEGTGDPAPDNVRPIHGTDKVTITTAGKNLLDFNGITQYGITGTKVNGVAHIAGTATTTAYPINFVTTEYLAGTYVWSISELPTGVQCQYTKNGEWAGYVSQGATFTLTEPALIGGYVNVATGTNVDADIQIQLEFGSTASEFTPYLAPSQTVLTLPQTVYTCTIGSEGGESRDVGIVYNGTNIQWATGFGGFMTSQSLVAGYDNPDAMPELLCDIYPVMPYNQATQAPRAMSVIYGGEGYTYNGRIVVRDNIVSTLSEFITQLNGHQIVYRTTPTTFAVPSVTIPTPTGSATTWATAEDGTVDEMKVTYVGKV